MWAESGRKFVALIAILAAMTACGTPESLSYPPGKTLKITKNVWSAYQEYLGMQGGVRKEGAFLVVLHNDVGVGSRWSYCPPSADYCTGPTINLANDMCKQEKLKCVLFARGTTEILPYEIVD
ncbi:hypothetical protein A8950_1560 [Dongia mobilis]|uniref:Uncharacterized protein n=1 Tax=Dongia mobilis TaxID=578943 RepID=A0A4R6WPZ5_9PROT|nr:hypothetical protein [Dongia mobilis]TDQ83274.1 hypothetical protein A8950_1560 [Dongia mobilis]